MKSVLRTLRELAASRALTPLVLGFFFLLYLAVAFRTDETLVTLMAISRDSILLQALLALVPLNLACRLALESGRHLARRRALAGGDPLAPPGLFDEIVTIAAVPRLAELETRFAALGYRTRRTERSLAAWRGWSTFPARVLFLAGSFCLFAGILVSLVSRESRRLPVIEGEVLPGSGAPQRVERISLSKTSSLFLDRTLAMELEATPQGSGSRSFGLYPPALFEGSFVYPRYLGIVPLIRLAAPGLPQGYEAFNVLNIYPAGKEDKVELSNTPYSIMLSLAEPDPGNELFMTGRMTFQFKLYKGKDLVFAGSAPLGATSVHDGYSLSFPEFRRMVFTDFIRDYGVLLIWAAAFLLAASWLWWLPVRLVFPRREMLFSCGEAGVVSHSWAEGGGRRHAGVFHEALDIIEANKAGSAGGDL